MSIIQGSGMNPMAQSMWDSAPPLSTSSSVIPTMQVDWKETAEGHVIKADLPGVRKEEVKVELERGGVLVISGERHRELEEKGDTWRQMERTSGKFTRRLQLPDDAKVEAVKAFMEHGVLTITVPKADLNKPQIEASEKREIANN
ncbi:hypothetical protein Cni_G06093 [Canna indica]|uniref:SHSP domain-containing protein n=1 Tax=Canna indica TaxID=4628 RepID=A0AAQ3K0S6_9LILI|nr:hypothetical protein Cni_G06093 [Canna indica]